MKLDSFDKFILTSTSEIKQKALVRVLQKLGLENKTVIPVNTDGAGNPEQPVGIGGAVACKNRVQYVIDNFPIAENELVVSIENAIDCSEGGGSFFDIVHVMCYHEGRYWYRNGGRVEFPSKFWNIAFEMSDQKSVLGWNHTVGDAFAQELGSDPKNWMATVNPTFDRLCQIEDVLYWALKKLERSHFNHTDVVANTNYSVTDVKIKLDTTSLITRCDLREKLLEYAKIVLMHTLMSDDTQITHVVVPFRNAFGILVAESLGLDIIFNTTDYPTESALWVTDVLESSDPVFRSLGNVRNILCLFNRTYLDAVSLSRDPEYGTLRESGHIEIVNYST